MFKAVAFGLAVGAGIQAWRNWPADGPTTPAGMLVVFLIGLVCAFAAGRARRRPGATAVAVASASAEAAAVSSSALTVNLFPPVSTIPDPAAIRFPDESTSWIAGPRHQLELDQLDGSDVADLLDAREMDQA